MCAIAVCVRVNVAPLDGFEPFNFPIRLQCSMQNEYCAVFRAAWGCGCSAQIITNKIESKVIENEMESLRAHSENRMCPMPSVYVNRGVMWLYG